MRIGVDLDGTVYQWERAARWLLREFRGYPESGPMGLTSDHWHYIQDNVKPEDWTWLWDQGIGLGLFGFDGWVYYDALDPLGQLGRYDDLVVITKRPRRARYDTVKFLSSLFVPVAEVHILSDGRRKSDVFPRCDVYIDDSPEVVGDLAANTDARVLMIDRPWNREVRYAHEPKEGGRILRVDWPEVPDLVLKEAK